MILKLCKESSEILCSIDVEGMRIFDIFESSMLLQLEDTDPVFFCTMILDVMDHAGLLSAYM